MASVKTSKRINLTQLDVELGSIGLRAVGAIPFDPEEKTIEADIPQSTLEAAVEAHVAVDPMAKHNTVRDQITAAMDGLANIIASPDLAAGTLTAAQLSNAARQLQSAVKLEARTLRVIIRRLMNDYSGTD